MKGESTYNKYKRQNIIMKSLLSADARNFLLERKDWKERVLYLKQCMSMYRKQKLKDFANHAEGGK